MDSNILCFIGGMLVTYVLFVLDEVYTYFRNRRQQKSFGKEDIK